jgi:nucleotide-binding universal stress UspA family protein
MSIFQHILFPVDFSERSVAIRPFVTSLAERLKSKLTLLNIVEIPLSAYEDPMGGVPFVFDLQALTEQQRKELESFLETPSALRIEKVVEEGDPAIGITSYAERNRVDLIILPTHGYGKFRGLLLGSVTAKVLHDAKCAVWTTAHTEDPRLATKIDLRTMLCAIDLMPENADLIRQAASLAGDFNAKLRLVHAVPAAEAGPEKYMGAEFNRSLIEWSRGQIGDLQRKAGTELEVCIMGGQVSAVIREAALRHKADLVVIGRGRLRETLGRLRTNTYAVIRDAPCPVLSV